MMDLVSIVREGAGLHQFKFYRLDLPVVQNWNSSTVVVFAAAVERELLADQVRLFAMGVIVVGDRVTDELVVICQPCSPDGGVSYWDSRNLLQELWVGEWLKDNQTPLAEWLSAAKIAVETEACWPLHSTETPNWKLFRNGPWKLVLVKMSGQNLPGSFCGYYTRQDLYEVEFSPEVGDWVLIDCPELGIEKRRMRTYMPFNWRGANYCLIGIRQKYFQSLQA